MKLWTVQSLSVYQQLQDQQTYHCDEALCPLAEEKTVRQAYLWMAEQMEKRVSAPPEGVRFPIWGWHTINWKHKSPDLRMGMFRYYKETHVCIELEVPDEEVLLSDFDAWHSVLNRRYIDFSFSEEEYNREISDFEALSEEDRERAKRESWERIFFITPYQNSWTSIGEYVQATFWEIRPEYIKAVRFIKGKK